jgi:hypothetical protein
MEKRQAWIAPAGILATLLFGIPTSSYRDFLVSKYVWQAFFLLLFFANLGWLIYTLFNRPQSVSIEAIIEELRKGSPGGVNPVESQTQQVSHYEVASSHTQPVDQSPSVAIEEFNDVFERGLGQWDYTEDWSVIRKEAKHALVVTDSGAGGIAVPCFEWTDYVFDFETKIVRANTSWIIRAKDLATYAMLQCHQERIHPHFRLNGNWTVRDALSLPITLPLDVWFGVRIEVKGFDVKVTVTVEGNERTLPLMNNLLRQPAAPIEYAHGSVGFRESGNECSQFRNVSVRKI